MLDTTTTATTTTKFHLSILLHIYTIVRRYDNESRYFHPTRSEVWFGKSGLMIAGDGLKDEDAWKRARRERR